MRVKKCTVVNREIVPSDHLPALLAQVSPLELSQMRAEAVCAAVAEASNFTGTSRNGGIGDFLFPVGVGGARLVVRARGSAAAMRNRRVEVHFLGLT